MGGSLVSPPPKCRGSFEISLKRALVCDASWRDTAPRSMHWSRLGSVLGSAVSRIAPVYLKDDANIEVRSNAELVSLFTHVLKPSALDGKPMHEAYVNVLVQEIHRAVLSSVSPSVMAIKISDAVVDAVLCAFDPSGRLSITCYGADARLWRALEAASGDEGKFDEWLCVATYNSLRLGRVAPMRAAIERNATAIERAFARIARRCMTDLQGCVRWVAFHMDSVRRAARGGRLLAASDFVAVDAATALLWCNEAWEDADDWADDVDEAWIHSVLHGA